MIVDTSVIIAVLKSEDGFEHYVDKILACEGDVFMSAASYLEAAIVTDRDRKAEKSARLDEILAAFDIKVVEISPETARTARQAHRAYGRGSGHAAKLNFGDCFSYALASDRRLPLLFKGDDFSHTDILCA